MDERNVLLTKPICFFDAFPAGAVTPALVVPLATYILIVLECSRKV
jgi:hypothetical protein